MFSLPAKLPVKSTSQQQPTRFSPMLPGMFSSGEEQHASKSSTQLDSKSELASKPDAALLRQLAKSIQAIEIQAVTKTEVCSTGSTFLDSQLPGGGLARGSMIEWLSHGSGDGAFTLALMAAKSAMEDKKYVVLIDPQQKFYPPAAKAFGLDLDRFIVLHPASKADAMWSFDQALRCPSVAAVIAWQDRLDETNARRLQLAAEQSDALGMLLRNSTKFQSQTHWADMTWQVNPLPSLPTLQSDAPKKSARFIFDRPEGIPPYSDNYRWLNLELKRMRAGRGKSSLASQIAAGEASYLVAIDGHQGRILARRGVRPNLREVQHDSSSALHLAAELAMPARRSRHAGSQRTAVQAS